MTPYHTGRNTSGRELMRALLLHVANKCIRLSGIARLCGTYVQWQHSKALNMGLDNNYKV